MPRLRKPTGKYDPKEIVKVWNTSDSPIEVAEKFHMTKEQVIQIAAVYRRNKVFMKNMKKGPDARIDWNELQKFSKVFEKQVVNQ